MKISREFAAQLENRKADEIVRAVVVLGAAEPAKGNGRRMTRQERARLIEDARCAVEAATEEIAKILETFRGRRLESGLDALGSLALETTPAGIKALAELSAVKAILEDQPVSLISR